MKRLASILLPLAALLAGVSGPATAADVQSDTILWETAPCATGEMTAHASPGRLIWVGGWIEPCAGTPAPDVARYAVIYFRPTAGFPGQPLRYAQPTGRTWFEGQLNTRRDIPTAACLAFSPSGLLSCVGIDVGDDPDLLVVTPIPTDHPRVSVLVWGLIDNYPPKPDPYCGTCV